MSGLTDTPEVNSGGTVTESGGISTVTGSVVGGSDTLAARDGAGVEHPAEARATTVARQMAIRPWYDLTERSRILLRRLDIECWMGPFLVGMRLSSYRNRAPRSAASMAQPLPVDPDRSYQIQVPRSARQSLEYSLRSQPPPFQNPFEYPPAAVKSTEFPTISTEPHGALMSHA